MARSAEDDESESGPVEAIEEPSWVIPVTVITIVAILSLGFLAYYFAPTVSEVLGHAPKPSVQSQPVDVVIGGVRHLIPANFTRFAYGRRGGPQDKIELYALLPDLKPFEPDLVDAFQDFSADSNVAFFEIETKGDQLSEDDRFRKLYLKLVSDAHGDRGPYGLRHYSFEASTAYHDEDLYVLEREDGTVVMFRCTKELPKIVSPGCRRDLDFGSGLVLRYRFARRLLGDWQRIDENIRALARSFQVASKPQ